VGPVNGGKVDELVKAGTGVKLQESQGRKEKLRRKTIRRRRKRRRRRNRRDQGNSQFRGSRLGVEMGKERRKALQEGGETRRNGRGHRT
jgi:hypothetical protein